MPFTETHTLTLVKDSQRNLNMKSVANQTRTILTGTNSRRLAHNGWTLETADPSFETVTYPGDNPHMVARSFLRFLAVYSREDDRKPQTNDLAALAKKLDTVASVAANGKWTLMTVDDADYIADAGVIVEKGSEAVPYADCAVPDDWREYFSHLYGLDYQVEILISKLQAAIDSDWINRFHAVLVGPPGCGKSDVAESLMRALGPDAVIRYDATALTSAGAIKDLTDREILPRVMVVEEFEKITNKDVSAFLLGVMDTRGEIRKTTARTNIQQECKMFCVATVNDYSLFKSIQSGAIASRFRKPIGFKRPSREMRALILSREIEKINGDERWIEPTLNYCESIGEDDPRVILDICLSGRERLLDGSYQKMLDATMLSNDMADWASMEVDPDDE